MPAFSTETTSSGACKACGAYGGTSHQSCRPGRHFRLEVSRRSRNDRRLSALVREQERLQNSLINGLRVRRPGASRRHKLAKTSHAA